jgi:predicted dehydrogenase
MADLTTFIPVRKRPTGPVETFRAAAGETTDTPMETEDAAGILLRLSGGARAVLTVSQVSAGRKNRLSWEIDGSEQALAWSSESPEELWIGHRDRPNELLLREAGDYPPGHAEGFPDTFKALYRAVYAAVAAGEPGTDYPTFADGHDEAVIADAIARSHAEQRWVSVTPVPQEV